MKVAAALNEVKYTHSLIIDCIPTNASMVVQDCLTYRNARDLQNYLTQGTAGYTYKMVLVKVAELISICETLVKVKLLCLKIYYIKREHRTLCEVCVVINNCYEIKNNF